MSNTEGNMSKTQQKEAPYENILEIFSYLLLKPHFEWKI